MINFEIGKYKVKKFTISGKRNFSNILHAGNVKQIANNLHERKGRLLNVTRFFNKDLIYRTTDFHAIFN